MLEYEETTLNDRISCYRASAETVDGLVSLWRSVGLRRIEEATLSQVQIRCGDSLSMLTAIEREESECESFCALKESLRNRCRWVDCLEVLDGSRDKEIGDIRIAIGKLAGRNESLDESVRVKYSTSRVEELARVSVDMNSQIGLLSQVDPIAVRFSFKKSDALLGDVLVTSHEWQRGTESLSLEIESRSQLKNSLVNAEQVFSYSRVNL